MSGSQSSRGGGAVAPRPLAAAVAAPSQGTAVAAPVGAPPLLPSTDPDGPLPERSGNRVSGHHLSPFDPTPGQDEEVVDLTVVDTQVGPPQLRGPVSATDVTETSPSSLFRNSATDVRDTMPNSVEVANLLAAVAEDLTVVATELATFARAQGAHPGGALEQDFIDFARAFVCEWRHFRGRHPQGQPLLSHVRRSAPSPPQAHAPAVASTTGAAVAAPGGAPMRQWECEGCASHWAWNVHHCEICTMPQISFQPCKKPKNAR